MTKQKFIENLRARLQGLPRRDVEERLHFYSEIIDDRMEDGLSEERAVSEIGSVKEVASQIMAEASLAQAARMEKRRRGAWEIVLLVLGSPIWLSLAVAAFAVILSFAAVLWSVILSFWAVFASLVSCVVGVAAVGGAFAFTGMWIAGGVAMGAAFICAGLAILTFFGCVTATKGAALLTASIARGMKKCFIRGYVS